MLKTITSNSVVPEGKVWFATKANTQSRDGSSFNGYGTLYRSGRSVQASQNAPVTVSELSDVETSDTVKFIPNGKTGLVVALSTALRVISNTGDISASNNSRYYLYPGSQINPGQTIVGGYDSVIIVDSETTDPVIFDDFIIPIEECCGNLYITQDGGSITFTSGGGSYGGLRSLHMDTGLESISVTVQDDSYTYTYDQPGEYILAGTYTLGGYSRSVGTFRKTITV